jgi:hypothetical protein
LIPKEKSEKIKQMAMIDSRNRGVIVGLLLAAALALDMSMGFVPPSPPKTSTLTTSLQRTFVSPIKSSGSFVVKARGRTPTTSLRMAGGDFDESKYTEAAWSAIATLTKAAEYYEASTVEAPIMLDIMLNPSKHNAGADAESAKRVVEKVLQKASVNLNSLRSELEKYLAKQPKVSGTAQQKTLGRNLQKVLEYARDTKSVLGVSGFFSCEDMHTFLALSVVSHICTNCLVLRILLFQRRALFSRFVRKMLNSLAPLLKSKVSTLTMFSRP